MAIHSSIDNAIIRIWLMADGSWQGKGVEHGTPDQDCGRVTFLAMGPKPLAMNRERANNKHESTISNHQPSNLRAAFRPKNGLYRGPIGQTKLGDNWVCSCFLNVVWVLWGF